MNLAKHVLLVFLSLLLFQSEKVLAQDIEKINPVDRSLIYPYHQTLDAISTAGAYTSLILPGISVLGHMDDGKVLMRYALMYGESFLLTTATKELMKRTIDRNRPYWYFGEIPPGEEDDYQNSFPSGHTSYAFMGATFLSYTFSKEYPKSRFKWPVVAGSYAIATGVGVLRIRSGNHFFTDVIAGAAIGSFFGWIIPRLQLKTGDEQTNISLYPRNNGLSLEVRF